MDADLDTALLHVTRRRLLKEYPSQINACLEVLTEDEIWWRPNDQANAVGNLVLHLSGSNRYYLESVIGGRDSGRDRAGEFAARGDVAKATVLERWAEATRIAEDILNTLEPIHLSQLTERTGKPTTYAQVLLHVTHHNAAHMGQIVWITKMLHPGALDDIWIKSSSD